MLLHSRERESNELSLDFYKFCGEVLAFGTHVDSCPCGMLMHSRERENNELGLDFYKFYGEV